MVRSATAFILEANFDNIFVDHAENYNEVKEKIFTEQYDLIILDIEMPGSVFLRMIKELKEISPKLKIMLFSSYKETVALDYVQEGAEGFLNKMSDEGTLVNAVKSIFEQGYYYPYKMISRISERPRHINPKEILSDREMEVFKLLIQGNGNIEIARLLTLHMSTVTTYKKRIFEKLKTDKINELLAIYNNFYG